jgi:sporulation protein YlmC with PRC-barrel domain
MFITLNSFITLMVEIKQFDIIPLSKISRINDIIILQSKIRVDNE